MTRVDKSMEMRFTHTSSDLALLGGPETVSESWPAWPDLDDSDFQAVHDVMKTGRLSILGRDGIIAEFENAFARRFGAKYALSFSSGTASLHAACFACGVGPGWEVLTPSYTWISAITAILHANGTPVFCDVAKDSFHIDPEEIRKKATPRTKAVIVGHTWGVPAPMDEIAAVCRDKNIRIIEDASHAHAGKYDDQFLGTIGDIGCFSLQGTKALVAGEGGVLLTNEPQLYERAMVPGHHDIRLKQTLIDPETKRFVEAGGYWKYRAAPLAMAIANAQLPRLDAWHAAKQANYSSLERRLKEIPFLKFPTLADGSHRGFYGSPCLYEYDQTIVTRETFLEALSAEGAIVFPGYDVNWYQTPVLQDMNLFRQLWVDEHANGTRYQPIPNGALPNTDSIVARTMVLPSWAQPAPALVEQYALAFEKVAGQMDQLAEYQQRQDTG